MKMKTIQYIIIGLFFVLISILLYWQISMNNINPVEEIIRPNPGIEKPIPACQVDSDCTVDEKVVHCQTEAHCEHNECITYCVYNDVEQKELLTVSQCLDDIDPLDVKEDEFTLNWEENRAVIQFNVVLACNVTDLSGFYEIDRGGITVNYEYAIPVESVPCLCIRTLTYNIPNLDPFFNYNIIINKIEK